MMRRTGVIVPSELDTMHHRNQPRAVAQQFLVLIEEKFAVVADRHDAQHGPGLLAEHLPGHDVGVMLHRRDDDLVAGAEVRPAPATGRQD